MRNVRPVWLIPLVALASAPLAVPAAFGAQTPSVAPGVAGPRDSAELRDEAEDAQADFERTRVHHLPWTRSGPPRPCDEIVGRFCFWHDEGSWTPKPEHPEIGRARSELLDRLAASARALRGDGWIAGQRVRYLVEGGRHAEAAAVARGCRGEAWWCRALEGYAHHAAGDFAAAEAAFDAALSAMPAAERERWTDLELLLDRDLARVWKRLGAGARAAFARRLWWLADPLWTVPGNERRTEHFARHVLDRMLAHARSPYGVTWGADLRELTIRYGWSVGWERVRSDLAALASGTRPSVVGHDARGGRRFVPPRDVFVAPTEAGPGDWPLTPPKPRSSYAPAYADSLRDLTTHQLAVFRRGDLAVIVAGYDLEGAALAGASARSEAALVVAADPDAPPAMARGPAPRGALRLQAPWTPAIVSVEARAERWAARARYGLGLEPEPPAVSDLLLLGRGVPLPASLDEAAPLARASTEVEPRERLGVYFEIYPPEGPAASARITVGLRDARGGFWRGLGAALGIGETPTRDVGLAWSEEVAAGATVHPRALVVELPNLPEGDYVLELEVAFPGEAPQRAERPILVR